MTLGVGPRDLPDPFAAATGGQFVVVALRLLLPLLILRWPLVGGVLALLADAFDVVIVEWFGEGGMGTHYTELDKALDTYYLALEAFVAWSWANSWARNVALALFTYRLTGVGLFALTQADPMLLVFPNVIEHWWLYCLVVAQWWPELLPSSWRSTLVPLAILTVTKLGQEYLLHVADAQPWDWFKESILGQQ